MRPKILEIQYSHISGKYRCRVDASGRLTSLYVPICSRKIAQWAQRTNIFLHFHNYTVTKFCHVLSREPCWARWIHWEYTTSQIVQLDWLINSKYTVRKAGQSALMIHLWLPDLWKSARLNLVFESWRISKRNFEWPWPALMSNYGGMSVDIHVGLKTDDNHVQLWEK